MHCFLSTNLLTIFVSLQRHFTRIMKESLGQYISKLMEREHYNQSTLARELGVSRQMLSNIVLDRREVSLPLSLKIESLFSLQEGSVLKIQDEYNVQQYKKQLRDELFEKLQQAHAFWSYDEVKVSNFSDELLIENVFVHLDIDDISKLFELFPKNYVQKVWRENMAVQGEYLFDLNVMIALVFFHIKKPEAYIRRQELLHIKKLTRYA